MKLFIDDLEKGISRITSHPEFNRVLLEKFYISAIEEFSPFGNDEGWDTLKELEKMYRREGEELFLLDFFDDYLMRSYGWDTYEYLPTLRETKLEDIIKLLEKDEFILRKLPQIMIATSFGQFKILGFVDDWLKEMVEDTIRQQLILNKNRIKHKEIDVGKLTKFANGDITCLDEDGSMNSVLLSYQEALLMMRDDLQRIPIKENRELK